MSFRLSLIVVAVTAGVAVADAPSPLDLVRGLRENGMPDLALEYLTVVEKANPPADLRAVLPLERANVQLAVAQQESDDAARDAAVAAARGFFETFLKNNPKHARATEATVAVARVLAIQARGQLAKAVRQPEGARKAAAAATRPTFLQAAKLFADGAKATNARLNDPALDPARKSALARETYQAEMERGINLFKLADTYLNPEGTEATNRAKAIDDAKAVFDVLGALDATNPICWQARAWSGACEMEKQNRSGWEKAFAQIREDARKSPSSAATEGVRMVEFFELQQKFVVARGTPSKPALAGVRTAAAEWLARDKHKNRPTPERLSVTYYLANTSLLLGQNEVVFEPLPKKTDAAKAGPRKIANVPPAARDLLTAASREYKKLLETDNEYSARAARDRTTAIRLLVGDPDQPPSKFTDFETCHMAALVQLAQPDEADEGAAPNQKARQAKGIALLERCRQLTATAPSPKDATEAGLQLAYAYLTAGRPQQAAVLGEHLARTARSGSAAAKGGMLAVDGYLTALKSLPADADDSRSADRDRAITLAADLEKAYPTDPVTDAVRFRLGRLFFEEKDHQRAFDALARVGPGYTGLSAARTLEGLSAYALVVPKDAPLAQDAKDKVFQKAVADMEAVPEPPAGATVADARAYLNLRTLLAQLHLSKPTGYPKAEQVAASAVAKAAAFTNLDATAKKAAGFAADEVRLKAIYAQAVPLYRDGKFEQLADRLRPALEAILTGGPANKDVDGEAATAADSLDKFRREVILLALQGKIREGAVEQAGELFALLEKLGGSAEATAEALTRLVGLVRPQLEEFRAAGKTADAEKLAKDVTAILEGQANKPNLSPRSLAFLGRSLRELGGYPQAVAVLTKVPAPPAEDLKKSLATLEGKARDTVGVYQTARLELARAHRLAGQLDDADKVLTDALGADGKSGWAKALDFKREAVLLIEDRAAAAPADQRMKLWTDARAGWTKLVTEYQRAAATPPKDPAARPDWERNRERLIPVFLGLFCDLQRCLARANTQLIADAGKRAEALGKVGARVAELETANAKSLTADVKAQFVALLTEYPAVKDGYTKAGGKAFVE